MEESFDGFAETTRMGGNLDYVIEMRRNRNAIQKSAVMSSVL
jgi:hypothetical protein